MRSAVTVTPATVPARPGCDTRRTVTSTDRDGVRAIRPLTDFLREEASAGVLLVAAAIVALVWANSPWSESYVDMWAHVVTIGSDDHPLSLTLREWVNDAAMTIFFFVVGLEIKREITQGELRDPRQAALPVIAAIGGMVVPATIYAALNAGGPGAAGWGIPMATDIAIVVGVVALLGSRAPSWLKLFLLALAIVDDIGAILVIAVFYSDDVSLGWLALAVATVGIAASIRRFVPYTGVYVVLGVLCWFALHEAHIHPTLTGVAFGLLTPVTPRRGSGLVDVDEVADSTDDAIDVDIDDVGAAARADAPARDTVSVVEWLEHMLHPVSAFVVVPLFALANAGIPIPASELGDALSSEVTWGVILGLVVGKTVGIAGATFLAVRTKVGRLPDGVGASTILGGAALGGIGFTVSLFVTDLAFGDTPLGRDARLGVLVASLVAALVGTAILLKRPRPSTA